MWNDSPPWERCQAGSPRWPCWRIERGDDGGAPAPTVNETIHRLALVWEWLQGAGLNLKPSKCDLFQPSVTFLGHIASEQGVDTDPAKITALTNRPRLNTVEDVRSFLGWQGIIENMFPGTPTSRSDGEVANRQTARALYVLADSRQGGMPRVRPGPEFGGFDGEHPDRSVATAIQYGA